MEGDRALWIEGIEPRDFAAHAEAFQSEAGHLRSAPPGAGIGDAQAQRDRPPLGDTRAGQARRGAVAAFDALAREQTQRRPFGGEVDAVGDRARAVQKLSFHGGVAGALDQGRSFQQQVVGPGAQVADGPTDGFAAPREGSTAQATWIGVLDFARKAAPCRFSRGQILACGAVARGGACAHRESALGVGPARIEPRGNQGGIRREGGGEGIEDGNLPEADLRGGAQRQDNHKNGVRNAFCQGMKRVGFPWILAASLACADQTCPVVSEIAASPRVGETEWIELIDLSGNERDLAGWTLDDGTLRRSIASPASLAANGYLVVASDCAKLTAQFPTASIRCAQTSGWNRLSTESDQLVLRDPQGVRCDSIAWSRASWGDWPSGRSMERIDPVRSGNEASNWVATSHPLGGTPGWKGGIALEPVGGALGIEILSRRAAPGRETAKIRLRAPWNLEVKAEIYDLTRRRLATIFDGQIPATGELEWDARAEGRWVPPGVYVVVVEFGPAGRVSGTRLFRDWLVVEK